MVCRCFTRLLAFASALLAVASNPCNTWTSCDACTNAPHWLPLPVGKCSWCPMDGECHAFLSAVNPCPLNQLVHSPDECAVNSSTPPPSQPFQGNSTKFVRELLDKLFAVLKITDIDTQACATDFAGATVFFKDFANDLSANKLSQSMARLNQALSSLSRSTASCNVPEVQQKLDALATSVRWAKINTTVVDKGVEVFVDATDLWLDLKAVADAVSSNDPSKVGDKIGSLLSGWSAVTGGCGSNEACKLVDGLLRVLQAGATDARPCQETLIPAVTVFTKAASDFVVKNYTTAVTEFSTALDILAKAVVADSCGLQAIGDAVGALGSKLKGAVVSIEGSGVVKIVVGSTNVYDELFVLATALSKGDYVGAGVQMGGLLAQLRLSGCQSEACIIVEGLLGTLQVGFTATEACVADLDMMWEDFEAFFRQLKLKRWDDGLNKLGLILGMLNNLLSDCQVQNLGDVLSNTAKRLQADSVATEIGSVIQFLVHGADVSADFSKIIADFENHDFQGIGKDIGRFADWLQTDNCISFACILTEGILKEIGVSLEQDLKPCGDDLRKAEGSFTAGAALWGKGEFKNAAGSWATGLNSVALAVDNCGLSQKLGWIEQEANVLGLANLTVIDNVTKLLVHGSDFFEELYGAFVDVQNHDYRSAGAKMTVVMNDLSQWTVGHLCTSPVCYVVNGVMQYMTELGGDIRNCETGLSEAWTDFGSAFQHLSGHRSIFSAFSNSTFNLTEGMANLGNGFNAIANSVGACHLAELSSILGALAAKFLIAPEIKWLDELLHILIQGVSVEKEIARACIDFSTHDWAGFGYNLVKLIKTLLANGGLTSLPHAQSYAELVV